MIFDFSFVIFIAASIRIYLELIWPLILIFFDELYARMIFWLFDLGLDFSLSGELTAFCWMFLILFFDELLHPI